MFSVAYKHWIQIFLVQLSFFVLRANSRGVCPNNWHQIQGSCYNISYKGVSWNSAKSACQALGSKLAMVKSQAIQQTLASKINSDTWIGLQRDPNAHSRWLWVDGTRLAYAKWDPGEPNDVGNNEDCAHMRSGSGWNDAPCSNSYHYICETDVVKCPALNVSRLVTTVPKSCNASQVKFNTNCSFTCPQGYQLHGPSYKQCGADGIWTDLNKTVSCIDIDECSVTKNGGCSHRCANTAGSYMCECPDPELSLSPDNRTCYASGVHVHCNSNNMTIAIPKSLVRGLDREHLRLLDTTCRATETRSHFSLTTPLTGCNTTRRHTASTMVYSNAVLGIPVTPKVVITYVHEIEINFSCFYSKYGVVSSVGWKPYNRKLVFSDEGHGNFSLSLNLFPDKRFVSPYTANDFPVAVVLRKILFFEVSVTSSDKQLSIIADRCFATPSQNRNNSLKYEFITNGCPSDVRVKYHSAPSVNSQRFSMEAFKFIADHPFVFVHCHVIVCNASDPGSRCTKKCPPSGRGRRDVGDHMTDDVYHLAQGPIFLAREKRQQDSERTQDKNGFGPVAMVLFVMCAACLAGTALMALKKSPDKPVGYTVLATGDKE